MRLNTFAQAVFLLLLCSRIATAQQYYSFEEACRLGGQTTGACAPNSQREQNLGCIKCDGGAFHAEKVSEGCIKTTLSPVIDSELFVELMGLGNINSINALQLTIGRTANYNNAVACFHDASRMIIFDPKWAKSATAESYLVLGHEAGHHFCGHLLEQDPIRIREQELEADRFSGASIKRFEGYHSKSFLNDAITAANSMYSLLGKRSHPPRAARIEAIMLGYNSGSPCGDLAPGTPGFTAQPR
jgi:hypothetical protein